MGLSKIFNMYATHGHSLTAMGLDDVVVEIDIALSLLDLFSEVNLLVLGGDIYKLADDGSFISTYQNWFYEGCFSSDSINTARIYLEDFYESKMWVSFVVD